MRRGLSSAFPALFAGLLGACAAGAPAGSAAPANAPVPIAVRSASAPTLPQAQVEIADPHQVVELVGSKAKLVSRELRQARARGDSASARCLDEDLSQMHAEARRAREQADALAAAKSRNDARGVRQHRVMLGVVLEDADELASHAQRCGADSGGQRRAEL